jgi:hypothetical protein
MKNIEIVGEPLEIQSTVKNNNIEAIDKLAKDIANSVKGIS